MNAKHTPGPFSISGISGDNHVMARVGHKKCTVAIVPGWPGLDPDEHEANKLLFSTSSELLDTLKDLDLRCTQTLIAHDIGKTPMKKQIRFLLREIERMQAIAVAAVLKAEGK